MVTAREARASFKKETGSLWVVNVLSAATRAEIVPPAVTLVKQGYPVYIVRANVNGKDYMRLRVGFFKNRSEADEVGKKIKEQLNFQDSWSTKADKEEYEEVAGFIKFAEKH
jgi:cell division septation protein DedD